MNPLGCWMWLAAKEGIGILNKNRLLTAGLTPEKLYAMDRQQLAAQPAIKDKWLDLLSDKDLEPARAIARRCKHFGIQVLLQCDARYPALLRAIPDPPLVLYVRGRLPDFDHTCCIGVVGTRAATAYGLASTVEFARVFAQAGLTVVSGLAQGIDAAAAKNALMNGGQTIAVLAGGLDICFPRENWDLFEEIARAGALVSENPPGTPHQGYRFPQRNRLISGMSQGVLVVEAPAHSGALLTAERAQEQGRPVFALPGPIQTPASMGCNRLIQSGKARLVITPAEVLDALGQTAPQQSAQVSASQQPMQQRLEPAPSSAPQQPAQVSAPRQPVQQKPEPASVPQQPARPDPSTRRLEDFPGVQRRILQAVQAGAETAEEILEQTGMPATRVIGALTLLELDGALTRENGVLQLGF